MIVFDDVTKRYKSGNIALDQASFQIDENEFVFLVGPSGAGKTTILNLILLAMHPSSGSIFIDGTDITSSDFHNIQHHRRSIGMVFQDFRVLHDKNVFENIAIALEIEGLPRDKIKKKVEEALELVGLADKKLMFPIQLSAGELQRVGIARAVVGDRSIIIADEPTGNLDPKTTESIMEIFKKLEHENTIIIATHNANVVNRLKKRVITIDAGVIKKDKRSGKYEL
ncbi:MAG: cell division ATP-binding protein FtsE [Candidatus Paceibacterota bacterium]